MTAASITNIYILQLEHEKYYVGKSADVTTRFIQHQRGEGAAWTRAHPPLKILKVIEGASHFDEDKVVKEYMSLYGIENVRGGSYVEMDLSPEKIRLLKAEIWGAANKCTRCGRGGHYVVRCYAHRDIDGVTLDDDAVEEEDVWECEWCGKGFGSERSCALHEEKCGGGGGDTCFRCGRKGHFANDCWARHHVSGYCLESSDEDSDYD